MLSTHFSANLLINPGSGPTSVVHWLPPISLYLRLRELTLGGRNTWHVMKGCRAPVWSGRTSSPFCPPSDSVLMGPTAPLQTQPLVWSQLWKFGNVSCIIADFVCKTHMEMQKKISLWLVLFREALHTKTERCLISYAVLSSKCRLRTDFYSPQQCS